jgi:hypothetical protein
MNKQFLSLLLLTSFAGTISASGRIGASFALEAAEAAGANGVKVATGLGVVFPRLAGFMSATGAKVSGVMAKVGGKFVKADSFVSTKIVNLYEKAPYGTSLFGSTMAATGVLVAGTTEKGAQTLADLGAAFGKSQFVPIHKAVAAAEAAAEAARFAARPWYVKTGSALSGYASAAKTATVAAGKTALEFAKVNKGKTAAITAGVVATGVLGYMAYNKIFSSNSISLNEQGKATLKTAMAKSKALIAERGNPYADVVMPTQLTITEHFTTSESGLPRQAVELLNKHVAYGRLAEKTQYLMTHQRGDSDQQTLAINRAAKAFDTQVVETLSAAAAA